MLNNRSNLLPAINRYALILALTGLISALGWVAPATAVEVATLFTVEVPLNKKARDPRKDAYALALREVLTRVSDSSLSRDPAAVAELFPDPASLVTQFRPGAEGKLWVSFDGVAVEKILRDAGQIVWGRDRPLTLVWLAVDWGQGQREIIAADDPEDSGRRSRSIDRNRMLRERIVEIARDRGLPLAFPLLDTIDLQAVTSSDIWGGFDERIITASKRYDASSILIGRVRPSSNQRNRWSYFFGGEERSWTGPPEAVVGRIADLMTEELAVGGNAPLQMVALDVSGVESVNAYGSVQHLLAGVALIEKFTIERVSGDTVSYEIEVRGGAARLRRALRFAGLTEVHDGADFDSAKRAADLEFFYSP